MLHHACMLQKNNNTHTHTSMLKIQQHARTTGEWPLTLIPHPPSSICPYNQCQHARKRLFLNARHYPLHQPSSSKILWVFIPITSVETMPSKDFSWKPPPTPIFFFFLHFFNHLNIIPVTSVKPCPQKTFLECYTYYSSPPPPTQKKKKSEYLSPQPLSNHAIKRLCLNATHTPPPPHPPKKNICVCIPITAVNRAL